MNRLIEVILVLTMVGTTLAFGGVQTITFSIMEVAVFFPAIDPPDPADA